MALKGPLTITIAPDRVEVRADESLFAFKPVAFFDMTSERPRLLAIGEDRIPIEPSIRVDLFKPGGTLPPGLTKPIALERFFRYLMKLVIDKYLFRVKPEIYIFGAESLEAILAGYQEDVLEKALKDAGGQSLSFRRRDQSATG